LIANLVWHFDNQMEDIMAQYRLVEGADVGKTHWLVTGRGGEAFPISKEIWDSVIGDKNTSAIDKSGAPDSISPLMDDAVSTMRAQHGPMGDAVSTMRAQHGPMGDAVSTMRAQHALMGGAVSTMRAQHAQRP
jgi:hypothetical protein